MSYVLSLLCQSNFRYSWTSPFAEIKKSTEQLFAEGSGLFYVFFFFYLFLSFHWQQFVTSLTHCSSYTQASTSTTSASTNLFSFPSADNNGKLRITYFNRLLLFRFFSLLFTVQIIIFNVHSKHSIMDTRKTKEKLKSCYAEKKSY